MPEPNAAVVDRRYDLPFRLPPRVVTVLFGALLLTLALMLPSYLHSKSIDIDFEAFYCGAAALDAGANPYVQEPLHRCEARVYWKDRVSDAVVPAPLPGVMLRALVPLARLPYGLARMLWLALQCAAVAATVRALVRLTGAPAAPVALALACGSFVSLSLGQTVPFCLLGIALCAVALRENRAWLLALALALVATQPQVLLAVFAAVALLGTWRQRAVASMVVVLLAGFSAGAVGIPLTIAYVTKVLPLQAYAELWNEEQFSLAAMLFQASVKPASALLFGSISYGVMVVAGVVAASLAARSALDRAYLALVPAAFAIFLGTYVHLQLYVVALPLAIVLCTKTQSRAAGAIVVALAVPWQWIVLTLFLLPPATLATAILARMWWTPSMRVAGIAGVVAGIITFVESLAFISTAPHAMPAFVYRADPGALAQYTWIAVERLYGGLGAGLGLDCARLTSLVALASLLVVSFHARAQFAEASS